MQFRFGNGDQPLAGYTIKRGVGVGGFGEVYFALTDAGKEVALKQIQRNLEVEVRGVRQCMNLKHPNLIALYDIKFDQSNQGWIVMEYVSGMSLRDTLDAYPQGLPREEILRWFGQITSGVAYLHDHGIVHRDLKPANIFQDQGIVKIGDCGLSKFISCSRRGGQTESVGTFHYMAPEIGKGEYGKEIDIYALGVILYELATGNVPFDGESSQEIIMKHLTADPDLSAVGSPIREVIARALAKNPAARFADVRDMVRPLGLDVDERYLPVRRALPTEPPVLDSHAQPARSQSADETIRPIPSGRRELPTTRVEFQEPVASALRSGWLGLNTWWNRLEMNVSLKAGILAVAIVVLVFNAGPLLSLLLLGLMLYVPYYAVWWVLRGPRDVPHTRAAQFPMQTPPIIQAPAARPHGGVVNTEHAPPYRPAAIHRPISLKQWKVARRTQLSLTPRTQVWGEVTGSWLGSTAVIAVFSSLALLFQIGSGQPKQPMLIGMVWAAFIALATAWIAIALGKRWQKEEGDWAMRSFVQLTCGFAVGALAYMLSEFLMVPWESITREKLGELPVQRWSGFFSPNGEPLFPAFLAYFPLVMGAIPWWKQVDPLRRARFSFWPVLWSVIAAALVHLLIPFPQPWGALIVAGASMAIQLSSPWINSAERLHGQHVAA